MALVFRFAARSDVGRVRSKNDDSAYAGHHLAVVADGMGGHVGGDVASASAVIDLTHLDRDGYDGDATTVLADEIQNANQNLADLVKQHPRLGGMGTTVTSVIIDQDNISLCHIGDSRAYRLRQGELHQITTDHTFVQRLIDEGRLRPEEAETHPHRNVLMRVLGDVDASPELESELIPAFPGERWLLCSDGLNAVVRPESIQQVLSSDAELDVIAQTLVDLTLERGAPDNVTVVVLEVVDAADLPSLGAPVSGALPDPEGTLTSDQIADRALPPADHSTGAHHLPWAQPAGSQDSTENSQNLTEDEALAESTPSSAAALRQGLDEHPHVLVGAAANATQTGRIPTVSDSAMARRATLLRTNAAEHLADISEVDQALAARGPRRTGRMVAATVSLLLVVVLAVAAFGASNWIQGRYYVGVSEGRVAIYNGVSQSLGPIQLSTVEDTSDIEVDELSPYSRSRVESTIVADDLQHAQSIVAGLRADEDQPQDPSASPSPQDSGTVNFPGGNTATPAASPQAGDQ
ncbi:PP2C family protein-serine/threonine phosphatase [Kocuria sp.]|uniref:PP2C family protein-serine/threonine phosphatase n=1 Tax=Kocuria sp. TaxID=1871328 RepID=UPI0026E0EB36|nr:PP2C family serine/threonine-protein phosphatase [Kocuria sp.]MDO5619735.1 protein phosphatase 2C domain-containing protein [Kocuria sp.]